jgi:hypothetical protein
MPPRPRLFVKKRGTRRTGARWAGLVAEGVLFSGLLGLGAYGLYWLIDHVLRVQGASWWTWFAMVIPIALIVSGALGLVALLWQSAASSERRAAVAQKARDWELPGKLALRERASLPTVPSIDAVIDSPGVRLAYRLPIDAASGWVSFTMAVICVVWNTFVATFVVQVIQLHREGRPNWLLTWLMVPFVVFGAWTLVALGRQVLLSIAVGTTRLEVSHHPIVPGVTYQGLVSQTGRLHVRWYQVQIVCEEQTSYQQGTDTRRAISRVYHATAFSQRKFDVAPHHVFEATFEFTVPADAMHSFVSTHNAVIWALVVKGRMARWGDFERRFPICVYPHGAVQQSGTSQPLATARM